ncbi:immunity protein 35 of polymorphic toxin system [Microbacterium sp. SLBN-154]|uniref:YrhB domain-containing protein n=1 Tax=Microbacterium sp. SLBN-154 TaxID=2768458 RepID=UPI0011537A45|nr:YrhB domain-containing protein [Microbacterium sp. SLBN-154]TQK18369.1 immunity protein 35 of polymorphic toxin system [Microbacterium sp. SLBN-154]
MAEEARRLVEASLQQSTAEDGIDRVVLGDPVESGRYWVFFSQGRGYVESGDVDAMLIGNAPIVVPKDGGAPFALPSVRDVDTQIRALASEDSPTDSSTA